MNPSKSDSCCGKSPCATRRLFIRAALGGAGLCYVAALGYPTYQYLMSSVDRSIAASKVKEVTLKDAQKIPVGTAKMFKFGARPGVLIHHVDGSWVALDAVCTHLGCTVMYDEGKKQITCACHGGVYDAKTGGNISGPPPKPLKPYVVKVTETEVVISRTQA